MFTKTLLTIAVAAGLLAAAAPAGAAVQPPVSGTTVSHVTEELFGNYNFLLEAAARDHPARVVQ